MSILFFNLLFIFLYFCFFMSFGSFTYKYFFKHSKMAKDFIRYNDLKTIRIKTIDEQKEYITLQAALHKNIVQNAIVMIILLFFFYSIFLPRLPNFLAAEFTSFVLALIFSYAVVKAAGYRYFEYEFINVFNTILFMLVFVSYIKFFYVFNVWIVIGGFIIIGYILQWLKAV